nr:hypothetical protein [Streptomyces sp. RPA4-5]
MPAGCRLVEAHDVTVNNAALTGESAPVSRSAEPVDAGSLLQARRTHLQTGRGSLASEDPVATPGCRDSPPGGRHRRSDRWAAVRRAPARGEGVVGSFVSVLGVIVALVHEGLPATLSVSLAIGVRRIARSHALVKKLLVVEALGSTTVVCTDKTGTLTQAETTVARIWAGGRRHLVSGVGYAPVGRCPGSRRGAAVAARCRPVQQRAASPAAGVRALAGVGGHHRGALLVAAAKAGMDSVAHEAVAPRTAEYPFDVDRKLMSTVIGTPAGGYEVHVKGAPQAVLARCTDIAWQGHSRPLDETTRKTVDAANDELASQGLRVLAMAHRTVSVPQPAWMPCLPAPASSCSAE